METLVVAHQGGWDEVLILVSPLVIFAFLRYLSSRRERREAGGEVDVESSPDSPGRQAD